MNIKIKFKTEQIKSFQGKNKTFAAYKSVIYKPERFSWLHPIPCTQKRAKCFEPLSIEIKITGGLNM